MSRLTAISLYSHTQYGNTIQLNQYTSAFTFNVVNFERLKYTWKIKTNKEGYENAGKGKGKPENAGERE
jgi:hypothetical protein